MSDSPKLRPISEAQAYMLAWIWCEIGRHILIGIANKEGVVPYTGPSALALLKRGLISPTGEPHIHPSGKSHQPHVINAKGLRALADFLQRESLNG